MTLTVADVAEHIEHELGGELAPQLDMLYVVNRAGHTLCTMHPWKWLTVRSGMEDLGLEANQDFVVLPSDVQRIIAIEPKLNITKRFSWTSLDQIQTMRAQDFDVSSSWRFWGAVARRVPAIPNLLRFTETFGNAVWARATDDATVTSNNVANPVDGLITADKIDDGSATLDGKAQSVPARLTRAGWYSASVRLKGTAGTAALVFSAGAATNQTAAMVDWSDATATLVAGQTTGSGQVFLTKLSDGWVLLEVTVYQDPFDGDLQLTLYPTGAFDDTDTGTVYAWGAQIEAVESASQRARSYSPNENAIYVPTQPEPTLEIWPTPATQDLQAFTLVYRRHWKNLTEDTDRLIVPDQFEGLYLEAARGWAKGWEEGETGVVAEQIRARVLAHPDMASLMRSDAMIQPSYGRIRGGAVRRRRGTVSVLATEVAPPS